MSHFHFRIEHAPHHAAWLAANRTAGSPIIVKFRVSLLAIHIPESARLSAVLPNFMSSSSVLRSLESSAKRSFNYSAAKPTGSLLSSRLSILRKTSVCLLASDQGNE